MDNLSSLLTAPNEGTVLAPSITFKGVMEINGPESITINGTFEGEIVAAAGTVFIGASGVMRGSVKAAKLIVAGTVEPLNDADLIEATEYLAIAKDGFLTSNEVVYGKIAMEMGAVVQAGMRPMGPRQVKAALHEGAAIKAPAPSAATPSGSILHFERERASATQIPAFLTPTHAVVSDDQTTVGSEHSEPRTGTHDNVLTPLGS